MNSFSVSNDTTYLTVLFQTELNKERIHEKRKSNSVLNNKALKDFVFLKIYNIIPGISLVFPGKLNLCINQWSTLNTIRKFLWTNKLIPMSCRWNISTYFGMFVPFLAEAFGMETFFRFFTVFRRSTRPIVRSRLHFFSLVPSSSMKKSIT